MRQSEDELKKLEESALLRRLPPSHEGLINFASNDYLGLSQHPAIKQAFTEGIQAYGTGSTASRLICGTSDPHRALEKTISTAKGTEAALTFATGYATAVGVLTAVLEKSDTVIMDKLCHASLIDGARMSGATIRIFPHNSLAKLESLLQKTTVAASEKSRVMVVTESVFSMDGDVSPLLDIISLCKKYGALLMVDEAHALGVLGPTGMGLAEQLDVRNQIDLHMGTLGKAAGVGGGYIAAKQSWIDLITNKARSFIYSTAPPPAQATAATAALRLIQSEEGASLRSRLWKNIRTIKPDAESAIIPWLVGSSSQALELSSALRKAGLLVPAIRFPTVPRNTARLRITLSATHESTELARLLHALKKTNQ